MKVLNRNEDKLEDKRKRPIKEAYENKFELEGTVIRNDDHFTKL